LGLLYHQKWSFCSFNKHFLTICSVCCLMWLVLLWHLQQACVLDYIQEREPFLWEDHTGQRGENQQYIKLFWTPAKESWRDFHYSNTCWEHLSDKSKMSHTFTSFVTEIISPRRRKLKKELPISAKSVGKTKWIRKKWWCHPEAHNCTERKAKKKTEHRPTAEVQIQKL
jgi:hypothetical protein